MAPGHEVAHSMEESRTPKDLELAAGPSLTYIYATDVNVVPKSMPISRKVLASSGYFQDDFLDENGPTRS